MQIALKSGAGGFLGAMTRGVSALVRRGDREEALEEVTVERLEPGELFPMAASESDEAPIRDAQGLAPVEERESFDGFDAETEVLAIFYEEQIDFENGGLRTPRVEVTHAECGTATVILDGLAIADIAAAPQLAAEDIALIPA